MVGVAHWTRTFIEIGTNQAYSTLIAMAQVKSFYLKGTKSADQKSFTKQENFWSFRRCHCWRFVLSVISRNFPTLPELDGFSSFGRRWVESEARFYRWSWLFHYFIHSCLTEFANLRKKITLFTKLDRTQNRTILISFELRLESLKR